MRSGVILSGLGTLRDFELGYYDRTNKRYLRRSYHKNHEIVAMQGSISPEAEPQLHIHASLSSERNEVIGGRLFRATVGATAEIFILRLNNIIMSREFNPETGLRELAFPEQMPSCLAGRPPGLESP